MRFDYCRANLHIACEEHKYDHCEMCNIARAYQHGYETAQENMPKDAVEVVRCGECKHMMADGRCMEFADDGIRPSASDFCSYGERREDGEA